MRYEDRVHVLYTKPVFRTRMEAEGRAGSGTMVWLGALRDTEKVILSSDWINTGSLLVKTDHVT